MALVGSRRKGSVLTAGKRKNILLMEKDMNGA